jgi:tetrahydromethanopterin S-methyltransferase subunit B
MRGNMITHHDDLIQGSDEWLQARCGLMTASEMKLILTPTLKIANNDKTRAHVWELAAQRITGYVEPHYISDDMMRGFDDEVRARDLYSDRYSPVTEAGFITNDQWGFTIGYSPDGLVGDDGLIECKSRRQKYQVQTISEGKVPAEYMLQIQTGLLVTGRAWLDFISYSGGLPMFVKRVLPDPQIQEAIIDAATYFEGHVADAVQAFHYNCATHDYAPTERVIEQEMMI